ncbi:hypothetical protein M2140_001481 [Clostridiales Family XIII bacterium PM5-7]
MDKRYIVPIIVTVLVVGYCLFMTIGFIGLAMFDGMNFPGFLISLIIPISLGGGTVYMLTERIREIKGGEEDEASKY